jgi:hypothetical protein
MAYAYLGMDGKTMDTSIYQGYDRYELTTTGCWVNSMSVSDIGTIGFTAAPRVYI